ncbi:alpha/beta fold hydrolase [Alkalinema pantanalense CENA528]|uniref:alpha/beta fold hydrolase n=1 Tax=Alkalinema pantanalense TaxID=1620705 RepID=UPI003D6FFF10
MRAKIRETEIFFDVEGSGLVPEGDRMREKPVAFLLHGGPGADHTSYKPTFSPLAQTLQLVYIDHRGQGRSARGDRSTYTLDNNVEDLEALRCYLGLEKIVVIGGSYGGMVAMAYAARYPQHVAHLIVYVTAAHCGFLDRAKAILAMRGTPEQQRMADRLWKAEFETETQLAEYFQVMAPLYSQKPQTAERAAGRGRTIFSVDAINVAFGGFLRTFDLRPELPRITAPTLVLAARHDWICAPEFSEEIAQLIPGAKLQIFETSGHLMRSDAPQALLDAIRDFVVGPSQAESLAI